MEQRFRNRNHRPIALVFQSSSPSYSESLQGTRRNPLALAQPLPPPTSKKKKTC
jgi:hypothetical protein